MIATEEDCATAVIGALNAAQAIAYDYDDVPPTLPRQFTQVSVYRIYGGESRADGYKGVEGYRVTTRQVAKTVSDARRLRSRTHEALEYVSLTVAGTATTPVIFETADPINPDDGWYSGLETWTFYI